MEQYRTRAIQRMTRKFVRLVFFVCDLDVFAIYKDTYKKSFRARYKIYLSPMFRRKATWSDHLRDRLRRPMQLFYLYLSVRFLILIVIQMIAHKYSMRPDKLNKLSDLLGSPGLSNSIDYYKSAIDWLNGIQDLLGNPYSIRLEYSLVLLIITVVINLYGFIIMPYLYIMDVANFRFMLDPETEIRRIDMLVEHHIDNFIVSNSDSQLVSAQLRLISQIWPSTLDFKHHRWTYEIYWLLLFALLFANLIHWTLLIVMLYLVIQDKCRILMNGMDGACYICSVFNWREWVAFFEMTIGHIMSNIMWGMLAVITQFTLVGQLHLVVGIRDDLLKCLTTIQCENVRHKNNRHSSSQVSDAGESKQVDKEQNTIEVLMQSYVKLALSVAEIRRGALFLNRCTEGMVIVDASVALPICMIIHVGNLMRIFNQPSTVILNYFMANIILTTGVRVYFLLCKQEGIACSILAELSVYRSNLERLHLPENDRNLLDSVAAKWFRYVCNENLSDRKNTSSIFGVNVNYGTVLSLNFAIITLVSVIISLQSSVTG